MISAKESSLCVDVAEDEAGTCVDVAGEGRGTSFDVAADDLGHVLVLLWKNRERVIVNGCATPGAQISWQ